MTLRAYQSETVTKCDVAWMFGAKNIIPVLPTGAGKTEVMGFMAHRHYEAGGYGVAMAHRSVLIGQMSMALCKYGIPHDIIGQKKVVKVIVKKHIKKYGRSFYTPGGRWKVASVDTIPGRAAELTSWINRVTLGFTDESHHVQLNNKWGRECLRFAHPLMRWLLPTATPERADGQGCGDTNHGGSGIADALVEGPSMKWMIENGYLTNFVPRAPMPADLDLSDVTIGANGEYNLLQLRKAVHRSQKIVGNIVDTYIDLTPGMLGIVFAVDIDHAKTITAEFNKKGVPAELLTGEDEEDARDAALDRYAARKTLVLVNVDLFGEGFDLPAIEVVMMGRPTASYPLYKQQWGRGGRLGIEQHFIDDWELYTVPQRLSIIAASAKPCYYVHDHVGNMIHFGGPPTMPRESTLAARAGRSRGPSDAIPLRVCLNTKCLQPFERFYTRCPHCHAEVPAPPIPTLPEQVDGDLTLYTSEMLMRFFGVDSVVAALAKGPDLNCKIGYDMTSMAAVRGRQADHARKLRAQNRLGFLMPLVMPPSLSQREAHKMFYLRYGVDVVQARLLGSADSEALVERIEARLTKRA